MALIWQMVRAFTDRVTGITYICRSILLYFVHLVWQIVSVSWILVRSQWVDIPLSVYSVAGSMCVNQTNHDSRIVEKVRWTQIIPARVYLSGSVNRRDVWIYQTKCSLSHDAHLDWMILGYPAHIRHIGMIYQPPWRHMKWMDWRRIRNILSAWLQRTKLALEFTVLYFQPGRLRQVRLNCSLFISRRPHFSLNISGEWGLCKVSIIYFVFICVFIKICIKSVNCHCPMKKNCLVSQIF